MGVPRYRLSDVRLTADGRREFEAELERLRAEMTEIAGQVAQAREEGSDPSENLMLRDALDALALSQSRIAEVETLLAAAEPADGTPSLDGAVGIGSRLRVRHQDGEEASYTLVSPVEANPRLGRISVESPIGRALVAGQPGKEVVAETPGGPERMLVLDVEDLRRARAA